MKPESLIGMSRRVARERMKMLHASKVTKTTLVHHIDGDPFNNSIGNLKIMERTPHKLLHNEAKTMKVICSYCKTPMPDKPGECPGFPDAVSHGICKACAVRLMAGQTREPIVWQQGEPCLCCVCNWHAAAWIAKIDGLYEVPVCGFCRDLTDEEILDNVKKRKEVLP